MKSNCNKKFTISTNLLLAAIIAALSRIIPHPPNFTGILSLGILAGISSNKKTIIIYYSIIYLLTIALTDIFLGSISLKDLILRYLTFSIIPIISFLLRKISTKKINRYLTLPIISNIIFYILSNFWVWLFSGMYPLSTHGLILCYTLAFPFAINSLIGTFIYLIIMDYSPIILKQVSKILALSLKNLISLYYKKTSK